jgi:hypothetical protein
MKCHHIIGTRLLISSIALILLVNLSSQPTSSNGDAQKNKMNFYGTVTLNNISTSTQGPEQLKVENISIGRMYQKIPVYFKPKNPESKPDIHTAYLDLVEIGFIEPVQANEHTVIDKFAGREYIEIKVTSNDTAHTEQNYIIERNRKVYCDQMNDAGPIKNEFQFEGIAKLEIHGYKLRDADKEVQCVSSNALTGSQEIMKEIEETSSNMQTAEPGQVEQLMTKLNNLVKQLKDSLYSIFSMS